MKVNNLADLINRWKEWAKSANASEDGWQALFPEWQALVDAALSTMKRSELSGQELEDVEFVWLISEEDEDMADQAKKHLNRYWPVIVRLAGSSHSEVRWQIYEVLSHAGKKAELLLRAGLKDQNSYARRRALLGLARLKPSDAFEIGKSFAGDPDPYIQQAAKELMQ